MSQTVNVHSRDEGFHGISYTRRQYMLGERVLQKCQDIHDENTGCDKMVRYILWQPYRLCINYKAFKTIDMQFTEIVRLDLVIWLHVTQMLKHFVRLIDHLLAHDCLGS